MIWAWTLNTKADSVYHYEAPRALSFASSLGYSHFRTGSFSGRIRGVACWKADTTADLRIRATVKSETRSRRSLQEV